MIAEMMTCTKSQIPCVQSSSLVNRISNKKKKERTTEESLVIPLLYYTYASTIFLYLFHETNYSPYIKEKFALISDIDSPTHLLSKDLTLTTKT